MRTAHERIELLESNKITEQELREGIQKTLPPRVQRKLHRLLADFFSLPIKRILTTLRRPPKGSVAFAFQEATFVLKIDFDPDFPPDSLFLEGYYYSSNLKTDRGIACLVRVTDTDTLSFFAHDRLARKILLKEIINVFQHEYVHLSHHARIDRSGGRGRLYRVPASDTHGRPFGKEQDLPALFTDVEQSKPWAKQSAEIEVIISLMVDTYKRLSPQKQQHIESLVDLIEATPSVSQHARKIFKSLQRSPNLRKYYLKRLNREGVPIRRIR